MRIIDSQTSVASVSGSAELVDASCWPSKNIRVTRGKVELRSLRL